MKVQCSRQDFFPFTISIELKTKEEADLLYTLFNYTFITKVFKTREIWESLDQFYPFTNGQLVIDKEKELKELINK